MNEPSTICGAFCCFVAVAFKYMITIMNSSVMISRVIKMRMSFRLSSFDMLLRPWR